MRNSWLGFFASGPLVSERMEATKNRASGFDYLRFLLATTIICFHSIVTCYGSEVQAQVYSSPIGASFLGLLPMFFALSGFLVAGSLVRAQNLGVFLGLRILRIFPALVVDTIFSALVIGTIFTVLPLSSYFEHAGFREYFLNIVGNIHYYLPGVFDSNPSNKVNGQLWTIPYELECYLLLTGIAFFGIHRRRLHFLGVSLALFGALQLRTISEEPDNGRALVLCFLLGVAMYLYSDRIRWNARMFALCAVATVTLLPFPNMMYLVAFPATYTTVYLGLQNPSKWKFLETGDYSYGLFLYGYPIQQILVATVPFARTWYGNIILAVPLALVFGMLSWHLVEKHALAQKKHLFALGQLWSEKIAPTLPWARKPES